MNLLKWAVVLELFGVACAGASVLVFLFLLIKSAFMGIAVTLDFNSYNEALPEFISLILGFCGLFLVYLRNLKFYRGVMGG